MRSYSLLCRGCSLFGSTRRGLGGASLPSSKTGTEFFYAASGIHHLFTASEEGVAGTANFHLYFRLGGPYGKGIPARAGHFRVGMVVWMNFFFHEGKHTSKLEILQGVDHILLDIGGNFHHAVAVEGIARLGPITPCIVAQCRLTLCCKGLP